MAIVAAALCTLTARAKNPRVIENPECIANSTDNTLTVTRVELSDTATVISFHATYKPGWWICLSRSTVLIDDAGRRYATRCGIGIGLTTARLLVFFIKLSQHCERGSANTSYLFAWELGIGIGLYLGYAVLAGPVESYRACLWILAGALLFYLAVAHRWFMAHKVR